MTLESQRAMLDKYCFDCHNFDKSSGGMFLELFNPSLPGENPEQAEKIVRKLRAGMMPPAGESRPERNMVLSFVSTLESTIDSSAESHPGQPGLHRLNRSEYANVIRDLLSLHVDSTEFLPADDSSKGFDNQAGTLGLSPALLEAYLSAAGKISRLAIGDVDSPSQTIYRVPQDATQNYHVEGLPFGTRGGVLIEHEFPVNGHYKFKVFSVNLGNMGNFRPFGEVRGEQLEISLDGERVELFDWDKEFQIGVPFTERSGQLETIDLELPVTAGLHSIGVTFLATNYAPGLDLNKAFERSTIETGGLPGFTFYPHIGSVRIDGPYDVEGVKNSPGREKIFICDPSKSPQAVDCARQIITTLVRRAYRGFHTQADLETAMEFFQSGSTSGDFNSGIEMALQRILADPKFIYRIETEPANITAGDTYRISDLELASRLSFFLWSSMPDDELLRLAEENKLHEPDILEQQVTRMLDHPSSYALAENFAGQWLALRSLDSHVPVVNEFPDFDNNLRQAFRMETELFFDSIIRDDRSVLDLLTADYTFVNERLAKHYGIPGIRGSRFRRVKLDNRLDARRGLLGKGSILTVSSQPGRTSPVIRGNWVLSNIIGVPAPDPPPDVPVLKPPVADAAGNTKPPSMREQMEQHRKDPACRGCHKLMDPIGFTLEPFNAIGKWRNEDGGEPINSSDTMYDGTATDGPADLRNFLLKYSDQFVRNVTEKILTYALGRGVVYGDMPEVRSIVRQTEQNNYRLRSIILAVVKSKVFQYNSKIEDGPGEGQIADVDQGKSNVVKVSAGGG